MNPGREDEALEGEAGQPVCGRGHLRRHVDLDLLRASVLRTRLLPTASLRSATFPVTVVKTGFQRG